MNPLNKELLQKIIKSKIGTNSSLDFTLTEDSDYLKELVHFINSFFGRQVEIYGIEGLFAETCCLLNSNTITICYSYLQNNILNSVDNVFNERGVSERQKNELLSKVLLHSTTEYSLCYSKNILAEVFEKTNENISENIIVDKYKQIIKERTEVKNDFIKTQLNFIIPFFHEVGHSLTELNHLHIIPEVFFEEENLKSLITTKFKTSINQFKASDIDNFNKNLNNSKYILNHGNLTEELKADCKSYFLCFQYLRLTDVKINLTTLYNEIDKFIYKFYVLEYLKLWIKNIDFKDEVSDLNTRHFPTLINIKRDLLLNTMLYLHDNKSEANREIFYQELDKFKAQNSDLLLLFQTMKNIITLTRVELSN